MNDLSSYTPAQQDKALDRLLADIEATPEPQAEEQEPERWDLCD